MPIRTIKHMYFTNDITYAKLFLEVEKQKKFCGGYYEKRL